LVSRYSVEDIRRREFYKKKSSIYSTQSSRLKLTIIQVIILNITYPRSKSCNAEVIPITPAPTMSIRGVRRR